MTAAWDPAEARRLAADPLAKCVACKGAGFIEWTGHLPDPCEECVGSGGVANKLADQLGVAAAEIERLTDELDHVAPASERDHLSRASRRMVETVMGDRDTLRERVRSLTAEVDNMRPIVESCTLVAELEETLDAHPDIGDPVGGDAEGRLYDAVKARTDSVHAYRSRKP